MGSRESGGAAGAPGRARSTRQPEPVAPPANGEFTDSGQMNAYLADYYNNLTGNAKAQVDAYQVSMEINEVLRRGYKKTDEDKNHLAGLEEAITTTKHDLVVYRGAGKLRQITKLDMEGKLIGGIIADKAFMSTSLDRAVGEKFAGFYNKNRGFNYERPTETTFFKINVPKGSRAFFPDPNNGNVGKDQEITFDRGSKLKITKVRFDGVNNRWELEADLIQ